MKQKTAVLFSMLFLCMFIFLLSVVFGGCHRKEPDFLISGEIQEEEMSDYSDVQTIAPSPAQTPVPAVIYVEVCGAVAAPGVYQLMENSRVFHAVEAAGGMVENAAHGYVNLAQMLSDGQQIYIPTKEEAELQALPKASADLFTDSTSRTTEASQVININTAGKEELMTLCGIGESKALAIIAYREEKGRFDSVEELMNVQGIKEGTFTKIKENIVIE